MRTQAGEGVSGFEMRKCKSQSLSSESVYLLLIHVDVRQKPT